MMPEVNEPKTDLFDLTGMGVGLTGGGGHLGRATAVALASAGAVVVICGRRLEPLEKTLQAATGLRGRVVAIRADISSTNEVEEMLDRVENEAGSIHGWVNNAYSGTAGRFLDQAFGEVETAIADGLTATIRVTASVIERMRRGNGGSIVNVSSMYGLVAPNPSVYTERPHSFSSIGYGAAKAGLIQFTRHLAAEYGEIGIRANAISPGPFPDDEAASDEVFRTRLAHSTMLGRVGEPREVGSAVVFLVSRASSFITGHNLVVDGGWTAW